MNCYESEDCFEDYEFGWDHYLHCSCHVCELKREENNIKKCVDNSCDGCKNRIANKRVRSWKEDIMKKTD